MSLGYRAVLTTATTLASTSGQFEVDSDDVVTVSCYPDLSGGTATIQILAGSSGSTEFAGYDDGTSTVQLTSDCNAKRLFGPAQYRVVKSATTGSTPAIYLQR